MTSEFVKDLENKVVIVTGSSSGIGEAIALLFARIGSNIVITGRNVKKLQTVAKKCESLSPFQYKPLIVLCDLSIDDDVIKLVNKTVEKFNSIDCLVTAAGVNNNDLWSNISDAELLAKFDAVMRLDVRSVLHLCQLCLPYLVKTKGSIVNISSVSSIKPFDGHLLHSMSKAAIDMLTKTLALECGTKGVRINSVNPGPIFTPMWDNFGFSQKQIEIEQEKAANTTILNRLGKPEEIAKCVVFLSSNASSFTTGTNMFVDGGFLCKKVNDNHSLHR